MIEAPRINPEDYRLPDDLTDEQLTERLKCPLTRLCNIYKIEDPDGNIIEFWPNEPQCEILYEIYIAKTQRIAIPKARALGFSTLIALIEFDTTHFAPDDQIIRAAIIDQTAPDAQSKLAKVKFAYEQLPSDLKDAAPVNNKGEMEFANGSGIIAGMRTRGKTPQLLHISEWGPIAHDDPKRSAEIVTGALQSASGDSAIIVAESTHKGGKGGDWYDLIKRSLETPEAYRTKKDFLVKFFPWWREKRYTVDGDPRQIDRETNEYFDGNDKIPGKVKETGHQFTAGQRLFYFKKKAELGRKIYAEFPTVLEECWMVPIVGAIYGPDVDKARQGGRINDMVMHYEGFPVYTAFDIGAPANTWCWDFQVIGDRINLLKTENGGDDCNTPAQWVTRIKAKGFNYGGHFLPHDGETLWATLLRDAGLKGVVTMPRIVNEWDNINDALGAFSRCFFNKTNCERGIDSLEAFRAKEEADGVTIRNVPVHDWASHASTAFGYIHQAIRLGLLVDRSAMPTKPRNPGAKPNVVTGLSSGRLSKIRVRR
jgi:hypothetical protein